MVDKEILFSKVIGMFRPCRDTYFPIEWLIEDFDFTEEEAR